MDEQLKQNIFNSLKKELPINPSDIDPDKNLREQVSLDSMQFVRIIARIEEELSIELPISIMEVSTLNEFFAIIENELS